MELTVGLGIAGIILIPLTAVFSAELRTPLRISQEISASRQTQNSIAILSDDALRSLSFTPGQNLDYGTFSWLELGDGGSPPIPVSARYFYQLVEDEESGLDTGVLFRTLNRGDDPPQTLTVIEGILKYGDVTFTLTEPKWAYDPNSKTWSYTRGKISVSITRSWEEGGGAKGIITTDTLVAHFRSHDRRPVPLPPPSN